MMILESFGMPTSSGWINENSLRAEDTRERYFVIRKRKSRLDGLHLLDAVQAAPGQLRLVNFLRLFHPRALVAAPPAEEPSHKILELIEVGVIDGRDIQRDE